MIEEKDKDFSIYEVPLSLVDNQLDQLIVDALALPAEDLDLTKWRELLHNLRNPEHEISIAVVGKYAEHRDAYKSVYEALDHAGIAHRAQIRIQRIQSESDRTGGRRAAAVRLRRPARAGRLWRAGNRGQGGGDSLRPRTRDPVFRDLPGPALRGDRICPQRHRAGRRAFDGIQQGHAAPGDLPARRTKDDHRQGRHDAFGRSPGSSDGRQQGGRRLRTADHFRAAPSPLRIQQLVSPAVHRQRHGRGRHESGRGAWWRSSSWKTIPGSWPCSFIPSSSRSPPSRIRYSPASSPRPSSATSRGQRRRSGLSACIRNVDQSGRARCYALLDAELRGHQKTPCPAGRLFLASVPKWPVPWRLAFPDRVTRAWVINLDHLPPGMDVVSQASCVGLFACEVTTGEKRVSRTVVE